MTTTITIKRVEGKSGGYYLASDGAWSPDGINWLIGGDIALSDSEYCLAYKQLIDSEAGGEMEEEPETFTGDAKDWGPGVYLETQASRKVLVCVDEGGSHFSCYENTIERGPCIYGHSFTRLSQDPADFPKILAEQGEGSV